MVRRWRASGLSAKAFAEREGIAYSTFLYWRRRHSEALDLVPVEVVDDDAGIEEGGEPIEAETRTGLLVRIPRDLGGDELRRLMEVLASC